MYHFIYNDSMFKRYTIRKEKEECLDQLESRGISMLVRLWYHCNERVKFKR
jgi:hypothetical protein